MMKKIMLSLFAIAALGFVAVASADEDCDPYIASGDSANACRCIWQNSFNGCTQKEGPTSNFCRKPLYLLLNSATDTKIYNGPNDKTSLCWNSTGQDQPRGCISSLHYFRAPGHGADIPAAFPYPAYKAQNCPCPAGIC